MTVLKTSPAMDRHRAQPVRPESECLALLNDTDRHIRYAAIAELARYGTSSALDALLEAVDAGEEADRLYAVSSLHLCPTPALPALARAIEGEYHRVRHQALLVLLESELQLEDFDAVSRIVERAKKEPGLQSLAEDVASVLEYL